MSAEFFIVDLRPEWRRLPCIMLWRPNNAGYAYPLPWAGRYSEATVIAGKSYYTQTEGRRHTRFAVRCDVVEKLAGEPPPGIVDGDAGSVVLNTGANRIALRKARYRLAETGPSPIAPAPSTTEERADG